MKEKISALLDGELEQRDVTPVLKAVGREPELLKAWERYHLISVTLKNELEASVAPDLADRIASEIRNEPTRLAPHAARRRVGRITKQVAGLAIAATVAGVAVISLQPKKPGVPVAANQASAVTAAQVASVRPGLPRAMPVGATRWETLSPELENTLNAYLVEHGEFTPQSGLNGLTSYARFVSYDAAQ
jgi:sigma-E factor negative regulatory protein RseA